MLTSSSLFQSGKILAFCTGMLWLGLAGTNRAQTAAPDSTLLSHWKMSDFDGVSVPNQVANAGELKVSQNEPSPLSLTEENGSKVLRFQNGQNLVSDLKEIPSLGGLGEGTPFSVKVTFTPAGAPSGYYGALFQAMAEQSGFRLVVREDMKVCLEIFAGPAEGDHQVFDSKTVLEVGSQHTVEARFDGKQVSLLIDDAEEVVKDMALPAPYDGPIMIGTHFNGIISEVKMSALK